jgi:hypothetical protein
VFNYASLHTDVKLHASLNLAAGGGERLATRPGLFTSEERSPLCDRRLGGCQGLSGCSGEHNNPAQQGIELRSSSPRHNVVRAQYKQNCTHYFSDAQDISGSSRQMAVHVLMTVACDQAFHCQCYIPQNVWQRKWGLWRVEG